MESVEQAVSERGSYVEADVFTDYVSFWTSDPAYTASCELLKAAGILYTVEGWNNGVKEIKIGASDLGPYLFGELFKQLP